MTSAGRRRLPPANRLQRIAAWTAAGALSAAGTSASRRASTSARQRDRKARACAGSDTPTSEDALIILALVGGRQPRQLFLVERADDWPALAVAQEHLDTALGGLQTLLALARQAH